VAVVVVGANADDRDLGLQEVEQLVRGRRRRAMMGDLENVDRPAQVAGQTARNQLRINVFLHVAGEEHPPCAEAQVDHD
jgi:hypothetical protein